MNAALLDDIATLPTLRLAVPTSPRPALTLKIRQPVVLPSMAPFISVMDIRFDAIQRTLHPRLQCAEAAYGPVYGTLAYVLATLEDRVKMPFMSGDLWALHEGGLIDFHVSKDRCWYMVACKGGAL